MSAAADPTMQIIVLGMHRSGTSAVSRLLNLSGAYFGPESIATPTIDENPKGYWERRDMRALCDDMLHAMGVDWWCPSQMDLDALPEDRRRELTERARHLIETELAPHGTFFIKEPRLCLLFPLFRPLLDRAIVVNPVRDPLQVARSLRTRNGFPLPMGIALWEYYQASALAASEGLPTVTVTYREVIEEPLATTRRLCEEVSRVGYGELTAPSDDLVRDFVEDNLYRSRSAPGEVDAFLTPSQRELWGRGEGDPTPRIADATLEALASFEEHHRTLLEKSQEARNVRGALHRARKEARGVADRLEAEREKRRSRDAQLSAARERIREMEAEREILDARVRSARAELHTQEERLLALASKEKKSAQREIASLTKRIGRLEVKLTDARGELRRLTRNPAVVALASADRHLRRAAGAARRLVSAERSQGEA